MSRLRARIRLLAAWSSNSLSDFARRFAVVFTYPICLNSSRRSIRNLQGLESLSLSLKSEREAFTQTAMISENFGVNATVDGQCINVPQDSKKIRKEEGRITQVRRKKYEL
jgi:hypothetical protein